MCPRIDRLDSSPPNLFASCITHRSVARDRLVFTDDILTQFEARLRVLAPELNRRRAFLGHCLAKLPDHLHDVVTMKYVNNLSVQRIAEQIGRSANAVRILLCRARRALAECLERALRGGAAPLAEG